MRQQYDVDALEVIVVSSEPEVVIRAFAEGQGLTSPVLADAEDVLDAYSVHMVWGLPTYLIDPEGKIVTRGIDAVESRLKRELGSG